MMHFGQGKSIIYIRYYRHRQSFEALRHEAKYNGERMPPVERVTVPYVLTDSLIHSGARKYTRTNC